MKHDTKSKVICRGGFGIEFTLWCGFHAGRDLFHYYISLAVVTLYLTTTPLHDFLKRIRAARAVLEEPSTERGHGWPGVSAQIDRDDLEGQ